MVSTKKVCRSVQSMLHIISRNQPNTFLLINLQKIKLVQSKILPQGLFVLKLVIVGNHPVRFGDRRHCDSGDKMLLIYHLTSPNHVFKGLCELMG